MSLTLVLAGAGLVFVASYGGTVWMLVAVTSYYAFGEARSLKRHPPKLTPNEFRGLKVLSKMTTGTSKVHRNFVDCRSALTTDDKMKVAQLLDCIFGDIDFNKRAFQLMKRPGMCKSYGVTNPVLQTAGTFAYKTTSKALAPMDLLIDRAEKNLSVFLSSSGRSSSSSSSSSPAVVVLPKDRILREHIRLLESAARLHLWLSSVVVALDGDDWFDVPVTSRVCPAKVFPVLDLCSRCAAWSSAVLSLLNKDGGRHGLDERSPPVSLPRSGDMLSFTLDNDRYIQGKLRPRIVRWLYQLVLGGDSSHLALVLCKKKEGGGVSAAAAAAAAAATDDDDDDEKQVPHVSHMWGAPESLYSCQPFSIGSYGNKLYRVRPEAWVTESYHDRITSAYGMPWKDAVEQDFRAVVEQWHENVIQTGRLFSLHNDAPYRILLALVFNLFSPFACPWRKRALFAADWIKDEDQVACSEFVMKAELQMADLLGQRLAKRLSAKDSKVDLSGGEIVDPHINAHRRLHRYGPGQVIYRGLKTGLLVEYTPSAAFQMLFE